MTKIAICASASHYDLVLKDIKILEDLGLTVLLPATADNMRKRGTDNVEVVLNWDGTERNNKIKAKLIRDHFNLISTADAVLVMNYAKHGRDGYIGPNVLMEMAVAFYLEKPIYLLYDADSKSPLIDEINGLMPYSLKGSLEILKNI